MNDAPPPVPPSQPAVPASSPAPASPVPSPERVAPAAPTAPVPDAAREPAPAAPTPPSTVPPPSVPSPTVPPPSVPSSTVPPPTVHPSTVPPPAARRSPLAALLAGVAGLALVAFVGWGLWKAYQPVPELWQGMVEAEQVTVATKVALARVEKLLVGEGAAVRAGQDLAVLASPELQARRDQAEAVLAGAQATEARVAAGTRDENLETLRATARSADAALALAEKTLARTRALHEEGVVAAQRLDEALAARDAARGQAEAAHQQVLRALRGVPQADKDVAAAQVRVAQAGVKEVHALERETRLVAPVDGEVAHRLAQEGELVPLGFPVFTISAVQHPWVALNVREDRLAGLGVGRELDGQVPGLGGQRARFRVTHIAAQGEFATWRATRQSSGYDVRSFEVRLVPVAPLPGLRPGMSVLFTPPAAAGTPP